VYIGEEFFYINRDKMVYQDHINLQQQKF